MTERLMKGSTGSLIVAAAILDANGNARSLPSPARHGDVMLHMLRNGFEPPFTGEQGFLLTTGEFLNREAAARHALASGQVSKLMVPPDLYSEDLW